MTTTDQPETQKLTLDEKYITYLASNGEPADPLANPLNIFDGLNLEDRVLIKLAKDHLKRKTGSS